MAVSRRKQKLGYLDFLSREDRVRHHRYVEEMKQYDMMRSGDINAISESAKLWDSGLYGHLSDDPLKNAKYRFVTTITLATRFAIEGGMDEEDAYNASDLYVQDLDNCKTPEDVRRLHADMMTFFTWVRWPTCRKPTPTSKRRQRMHGLHPLPLCMRKYTVAILAQHVHL